MALWIQRPCTCTPSHSSCGVVMLAFWACASQGTYTSLTVLNSTFEALAREAFLSPDFSQVLAGRISPAVAGALGMGSFKKVHEHLDVSRTDRLLVCEQFRAVWGCLRPRRDRQIWNDVYWRHDLEYGVSVRDLTISKSIRPLKDFK